MDLFDHAARLAEAERQRDRGMALASAAQDRAVPEWSDLAFNAITAIARRQEFVHVDDVLREFELKPEHHNAWGGVWMRAIRNRVIERTGTIRPCTADVGKHKHNYPVYRSRVWLRGVV